MRRILVIRVGRLGDTILATPVVEVLQQALGSDVVIDFATGPGASAAILEMDSRINRVFPVSHRSAPWRFDRAKRALRQHSRKRPYDLLINLECGTECDDFFRFVHYREFCGRPLQKPRHRPDRHCVDTEKGIYAELLGRQVTAAAETALQLQTEPQTPPVSPDSDHIVLNPGFSGIQRPGYRSHRGWPLASWQSLVERLNAVTGLSVMVNGTSGEQQHFDSLLQKPGVYSLFGSSFQTLTTALSSARALVTVDTGTMHLAMALGTPVIALFGPTNPVLTGPYSKKVPYEVLLSGVDCQPCVKTPLQKKCTFNRCMSELTVDQVYDACQRMIQVR